MPRISPHFGETVRVGEFRIEAIYLRFVADMLRKHQERRDLVRTMEAGIIGATPQTDNTGMPKGNGLSDPVFAAVERLDDPQEPTFKARHHLHLTIKAIDRVFNTLPTEQRTIIAELYWKRDKTLIGVARMMHMSQPQVCRKRNLALAAFARELIGEQILLPVSKG